ncbi:MAG TPA: TerC family protein [Dehalococcoidia bacterium]|nr:TerC family protein [Dehalococcoidia bacterium]
MTVDLWVWPAFIGLIFFLIALDLLFFHREAHEVSMGEAFVWSIIWTVIGVGFAGVILVWHGSTAAGEYLAGYVIERSLSVDNIFVFALIFGYFSVPPAFQHRVLVWGIVGAVVFRIAFIAAGASLLEAFHWMIYVFGGFLVFTGARMALSKEVEVHPESNPALRFLRRLIPITSDYEGTHFFVRQAGVLMATPLLAVLVVIETTDIVFAVDSIPAIFAVTDDAFIVFSSNAFAILGMRVLYFMLASAMHRFIYLKMGLSAVLVFVGVKMLSEEAFHMSIWLSLGVIAAVLITAIVASLIVTGRRGQGGLSEASSHGS